jgi:multimeric flavodoxin WrbA
MSTVLGICGSARKKGNTATLLREALNAAGMESELIFLSDLTIGFCTGCLSCVKNKGVCIKDDDMKGLLDKMIEARAIVLGSPNYYYDVSGLMKNMIDRSISSSYLGIGEYTGMEWHGWRPFFDKVGGVVICQAAFGAEKAIETFKCFAEYSGLKLLGEVIASVGNQTVTDFPEYIEESRQLGFKLKEALQQK